MLGTVAAIAGDQPVLARVVQAFDESPAALVVTRLADGRFLAVNRSYEALLGWTREEIIGRTAFDFDVYATSEEREAMIRQLRDAGSVGDYQTRMRAKSGELRHVLCSLQAIDLMGERCILSVVVDVTGHHRAEQMLRQREAALTFLAEASTILASSMDYEHTLRTVAQLAVPHVADWCAVHILDPDGAVRELAVAHVDPTKVDLAREFQRRYPPDVERQSVVHAVLRTGMPQVFADISDEMLAASAQDEEHLRLMRELGFCSAVVVPLTARDRRLGAITFVSAESERRFGEHEVALAEELAQRAALAVDNARLFAERTAAVEAVRRLNTELEQRVHARTRELEAANAELETFAYSVSHDLRAPLRSMDGFSQILLELYAGGLDERGVRYLTHVRESAQEMGQLIDALLRLSRLSRAELHRERIDLTALAASLAGHLRATDPDRTVSVDIAPNLVVEGDPTLLQAAMENLLGNAWKFTRQQESACIEVGMRLEHGIQTIYVRDNGAGFDMQYAGKLFAPFQRLHAARDYEGTGIGLATVQRIIHRHGGRIWAEGAPGQGATFFFTLGAGETGTA